jgi:hypothetical protein
MDYHFFSSSPNLNFATKSENLVFVLNWIIAVGFQGMCPGLLKPETMIFVVEGVRV